MQTGLKSSSLKKFEKEINCFAQVCKLNILKTETGNKNTFYHTDEKVLEIEVKLDGKFATINFSVSLIRIKTRVVEISLLFFCNINGVNKLLDDAMIKIVDNEILLVKEIKLNIKSHKFGQDIFINLIDLNEKSIKLRKLLEEYLESINKIRLN